MKEPPLTLVDRLNKGKQPAIEDIHLGLPLWDQLILYSLGSERAVKALGRKNTAQIH